MSKFPWRDTSSDIAGQTNPQFETPLGSQAKADKAELNAKTYSDSKLNAHVGTGGTAHALAVPNGAAGFISGPNQNKLNNIQENANSYTHPLTHPPSIISQDASNRFTSDTEKAVWNAKASADLVNQTTKGLMSPLDKDKLDKATNVTTGDTLMMRDTAGRAKVNAPAVSNDIARKAEVDIVQGNLDGHMDNKNVHVTPADHSKLDGIEEKAEVNQNAFARVNNVGASAKSDTLTLEGGTGITVSTDPATKRIVVTATGDATPGAHASSHMPGGSDPLPHIPEMVHDREVHGIRATNGKFEYWTGTAWKTVTGGGGVPLGNVTSFTATAANQKITLKWGDPADVVTGGITLAKWSGTRIVRKLGSYPVSENDGVTVVTNSVRDQYKSTGFTDNSLTNGVTYFYAAFPFTDGDLFTVDPANRASGVPGAIPVGNVTEFSAASGNGQVLLKWGDPANVVQDGVTVATWAGTKIVRKLGGYPANDTDGVVVIDSAVRDQYKTSGFVDVGLENGTTYFYAAFPRTTEGVVTINAANRAQSTPVSVLLGNVTSFTAAAGNAQIALKWEDPPNVVEGGITVATWAGTRIMRKVGSYPTSEMDGTLAVNSTVRDQYKTAGFNDLGLTNGTLYYYAAFPYTTGGAYTISTTNQVQSAPKAYVLYGVKIDTTNSNPATAVTYTDNAVGFTPALGNNGTFNAGSWADKFPFNAIKPCVLLNGTVNYYLNPNNYAQKADGSTADITSGVDGDVMIEFPKVWWKFEKVGNELYVQYSDTKIDSTYKCLAHMRGTTEKDKCYISAYLGFNLSSKLRSLSDKTPTATQTIGAFRALAQANGAGYDQMAYYQILMLQVLYLVMFKNRDSQTALGKGYVVGNTAAIVTGGTNSKGLFYGETTGKLQNKFCGIEDFYGNLYYRIDGFVSNSTRNMLIANQGFNDTGSGYADFGQGATANLMGYISDIQGSTETGFVIKASAGSETTYYADFGNLSPYSLPYFGSSWADASYAGAFSFRVASDAVASLPITGARLLAL